VRRMISKGISFREKTVDDIMTANPRTIDENISLGAGDGNDAEAGITSFAVVDLKKKLKGYVHLHDILGRGGSVNISLA